MIILRTSGRKISRLSGVASSERQASRTERRSSGTLASSLGTEFCIDTRERGGLGEDVPHVDTKPTKRGDCGVEVVSQANVHVTDLILIHNLLAPLRKGFEEDLDGHEQSCNGRFDGRLRKQSVSSSREII